MHKLTVIGDFMFDPPLAIYITKIVFGKEYKRLLVREKHFLFLYGLQTFWKNGHCPPKLLLTCDFQILTMFNNSVYQLSRSNSYLSTKGMKS